MNKYLKKHKSIVSWSSALVVACTVVGAGEARAQTGLVKNWPQQGGPDRNAILPAQPLNLTWEQNKPPVLWKAVAGLGTSPVVVQDGRVYTFGLYKLGTTAKTVSDPASSISREDAFNNPHKLPETSTNLLPGTPPWEIGFRATRGEEWAQCWDAETGKQLWATKLTDYGMAYRENNIVDEESSPLYYGGKLYFHATVGHLFCVDAKTGKLDWERNLYETQMFQWAQKQGNVSGPVAYGNTVMVSYIGRPTNDYTRWSPDCLTVAGFDQTTGKTLWITKAPMNGLRVNNGRLTFANIEGKPTVLGSAGNGTIGIDPTNGKIRWSYQLKQTSGFAWCSYGPAVSGNYIVDAFDDGHDDAPSQSWGLQIVNGQPKELWTTHDWKPYSFIQKSNFIIQGERLYGTDSRTYGNNEGDRSPSLPPGRGPRAKGVGKFQCRDVKTGKLLWSADFGGPEGNPQYMTIVGKTLVLSDEEGLWIGELSDNGIKLVQRIPGRSQQFGEPVIADGRLYIRQQDPQSEGIIPVVGPGGNLFCLDLRRK